MFIEIQEDNLAVFTHRLSPSHCYEHTGPGTGDTGASVPWSSQLYTAKSSCSSFLTLMYIDIHNFGTYYLLLCSQFKKIWSVNAIEGIIDELYQVFISCRKSCALFIWSESSSLAFKLIFVWKIEMQFYFPKTLHLLICLWRNNFPNLLLPLANCKISRN